MTPSALPQVLSSRIVSTVTTALDSVASTSTAALVTLVALLLAALSLVTRRRKRDSDVESVNYHFNRACNYGCRFCFHTEKDTTMLGLDEQLRGLRLLKDAGMEKINFSGGEPLLQAKRLGQLIAYCKDVLHIPSVTLVSNGSLLKEEWMKEYGHKLDFFAVSCDSFETATNLATGRGTKPHVKAFDTARGGLALGDPSLREVAKNVIDCSKGDATDPNLKHDQLMIVRRVKALCDRYGVLFKLNTVVNANNWEEDMTDELLRLEPVRWKVFQCLLIDGENFGEDALRDARELVVSSEQFDAFLMRHKRCKFLESVMKPENNEDMKDSYLLLDERMRFLNCQGGGKEPTKSIIDIGVPEAVRCAGFDKDAYIRRDGRYKWTKEDAATMRAFDTESSKLDW